MAQTRRLKYHLSRSPGHREEVNSEVKKLSHSFINIRVSNSRRMNTRRSSSTNVSMRDNPRERLRKSKISVVMVLLAAGDTLQ